MRLEATVILRRIRRRISGSEAARFPCPRSLRSPASGNPSTLGMTHSDTVAVRCDSDDFHHALPERLRPQDQRRERLKLYLLPAPRAGAEAHLFHAQPVQQLLAG